MSRARLLLALAVLLGAVTGPGCAPAPDPDIGEVDRVLIVSLPGVTWRDVEAGLLPNLAVLADDAAIGNLATRVGRRPADPTSAYLSAGAGTRALGDVLEAGVALEPGEQVAGRSAEDLLALRFGTPAPEGIVYLAAGATAELNDATVYGADVGMLGEALRLAGVHRAVVANADTIDELVPFGTAPDITEYHRDAVGLLMDASGAVPDGAVGSGLLVRDPSRPYGVRLDGDAVLAAADDAWAHTERAVVVVETSDLRREATSRRSSTPAQASRLRIQALAEADALLARLVDGAGEDAAVVVAGFPTAPGRPELGAIALRTPAVSGGLLRSATTGRDGYVQLADLGPTVLELLGEPVPKDVEGRPFSVADGARDGAAGLAADVVEATFRDDVVPAVTVAFIGANAVLLGLALWWRRRWTPRRRQILELLAFTIVGTAVATFLVGVSWLSPVSAPVYVGSVLVLGVLFGAGAAAVERRWPGWGIVAIVASLLVVIALDVAAGASLQVNTAFGYSVAVAGRFAGLGNLAFALFSAAAVLLACMLAERGGRRGWRAAAAVLLAALVVDGFPLLGADVGGTVAMVTAFSVTALVLAGRRVGWRQLLAIGVVAVAVTLVFALVDLARPEHSQTHLARFADLVLDGEWPTIVDSLVRRFQASFGGFDTLAWIGVVLAAGLTAAYVLLRDRGRLPSADTVAGWSRPVLAAGAGLLALALLGWTANDSSFAVPATMLIVVVPVLVDRLVHRDPEAEPS